MHAIRKLAIALAAVAVVGVSATDAANAAVKTKAVGSVQRQLYYLTIEGGKGQNIFAVERQADGQIRITDQSGAVIVPQSTCTAIARNSVACGNPGRVIINGNAGNDIVAFKAGQKVATSVWVRGGTGDDVLFGSAGSDDIWGEAGNDTLSGLQTSDGLYGGEGNDKIWGGDGSDGLYGGPGNDTMYGENGTDTIFDSTGAEKIYAGNDSDDVSVKSDTPGSDYVDCGSYYDSDTLSRIMPGSVGWPTSVGCDKFRDIYPNNPNPV